MICIERDLEGRADPFLEGLNRCFPGWGGKEAFDWCFRRRSSKLRSDLLLAWEKGMLIAGSGITYRFARRRGSAGPELTACMTASWTLPDARGRGLFREMIQASRRQAAARNCCVLMAFASSANASARGLAAAGAQIIPTAYVRRTQPKIPASRVEIEEAAAAFACRPKADASFFAYGPGEWRHQMIQRPNSVFGLRLQGGGYALAEKTGQGERLLDVSIANAATFREAAACTDDAWTVDSGTMQALTGPGFLSIPGGLFLFAIGGAPHHKGERWSIASGERM